MAREFRPDRKRGVVEIIIEDIPQEGLHVKAGLGDDWFKALLAIAFDGESALNGNSNLDLRIERVGNNVNIEGFARLDLVRFCDRCLKEYRYREAVRVHTLLAPLYNHEREREREEGAEIELVKEDLEFSFYEGDRFDLDDVVREQIVLSEPMKHLCTDECLGLCQRCGKNLNDGPCSCKGEDIDPRWSALKDVKVLKLPVAKKKVKVAAKAPKKAACAVKSPKVAKPKRASKVNVAKKAPSKGRKS